jgi:hypothetical protein
MDQLNGELISKAKLTAKDIYPNLANPTIDITDITVGG